MEKALSELKAEGSAPDPPSDAPAARPDPATEQKLGGGRCRAGPGAVGAIPSHPFVRPHSWGGALISGFV